MSLPLLFSKHLNTERSFNTFDYEKKALGCFENLHDIKKKATSNHHQLSIALVVLLFSQM